MPAFKVLNFIFWFWCFKQIAPEISSHRRPPIWFMQQGVFSNRQFRFSGIYNLLFLTFLSISSHQLQFVWTLVWRFLYYIQENQANLNLSCWPFQLQLHQHNHTSNAKYIFYLHRRYFRFFNAWNCFSVY